MKCECLVVCALLLAATNARSVREVKEDTAEAELESIRSPKCSCDWRYLKHYETKKCKPVFEEGCECPVRFDCPEEQTAPENVCEYKGKTYELGEGIKTSSSCEICSCGKSFRGEAEISCIPVECPSLFRPPPEEGCYEVYEEDKCCSVATNCDQGNVTEPICEYGGRTYHLGERIYPEEDPCLSCLCDGSWAGVVNSSSCHIHDCLMERHLGQLRKGCIPIYHEKTCCPIEFHCGTDGESNLNDTLVPKTEGACFFEGKSYSVGEELDIKHPTNCVKCSCTTPPDFTCVHTSCPGPPNGDYDNCRPTYHEGACCPTYDCQPPPAPLICLPVNCVNGCKEVWSPDGCSLCLCDQVLCSPPDCPRGCEIEYDVPEGSCPRCKCPITIQLAPVQCAPVNCEPECFEAFGSNGCTTCVCGHLCTPPKCDDGCNLQIDVPRGQCPRCVCPSTSDDPDALEIQCSPVKCTPACREVEGMFGCPTCLCGPLCSPPKCAPGCEIETGPPSGPCPGCVCKDQPPFNVQCSPPKCDPGCEAELVPSRGPCPECVCNENQTAGVQCAPVKCMPTCREAIGQFGCPTCLCDPLCSPPKCDPGCEIETAPFSGPCPGCVCDTEKTSGIECAPVKCLPTCREAIGDFGCPTCLCDPLCSPPKCDPGCEIETAPFKGPCPGCVCGDQKKSSDVQCSPVKCNPPCREAVGEFGCPTCLCDPLCSPPKCDPGCEIETAPFSGPCPGCVCGEKKDQSRTKRDMWNGYYIYVRK